jgi:raffinose/stachyose/melibiose transport system substrate-binding protein
VRIPDYVNGLATTDAPWTAGSDHYAIDKLLFDVVNGGFIEEDPTTTDWETSKDLLGKGEIASMVLGSWSIVQMQEAAADPADISYMPFPSQKDGKYFASIGGDYKMGVNKNSSNKEAAKAWLTWFVDESGFSFDQGGLPPRIDGDIPSQYDNFTRLDVQFIEQNPAPAGSEGLVSRIDDEAEIGLYRPDYRQRIVDAGRGATGESIEDIFADLNSRWAEARTAVGG